MLVNDFIRQSIALEMAIANLYETFARRFTDEVEFSAFWRLAAEAERCHAAAIRIGTGGLDPTLGSDELAPRGETLASLLKWVEAQAARFQSEPVTAEEALDAASHLEGLAGELHGAATPAHLPSPLRELFSSLSDDDRSHRKSFVIARQRFSHMLAKAS